MTKWKSNDFLYVKLRTRLDTISRKPYKGRDWRLRNLSYRRFNLKDRLASAILIPIVRADGLFRRTIDLWYPIHVYESGQAVKIDHLCPCFLY